MTLKELEDLAKDLTERARAAGATAVVVSVGSAGADDEARYYSAYSGNALVCTGLAHASVGTMTRALDSAVAQKESRG